jgi:hypothetical protein
MSTYEATTPLPGATCQSERCCSVAVVRVVMPPSRFTADGMPHQDDGKPVIRDTCELHWPGFRDLCARNGHRVTDTTGDLRAVAAELPGWRVFTSDGGRLYASTMLPGGQGITVDAFLVGHLRAQMREIDDTKAAAGHAR